MGKSLVNIFSIYGKILAILVTIVDVIYKYLLKIVRMPITWTMSELKPPLSQIQ